MIITSLVVGWDVVDFSPTPPETIAPACLKGKVVFKMSHCRVSETLPTGQLSNVPWRRMGVKYTNNEAYFDLVEEIDAIIDRSGSTVFAEIQGYVSAAQNMWNLE